MPHGPGRALVGPALGQLRSFSTLPHCVRQWAVGIPQYIATLRHTAAKLQWAVGSGDPLVHCHTSTPRWGSVVKPSEKFFKKFFLLGNSLLGSLVFTRSLELSKEKVFFY